LLALMPRAANTRSPAPSRNRPTWVGPLTAFVATVLVYLPALGNGFVWNDPDYVTKPALRSMAGLGRIWFEVGATEQYYPLLHSFFWLQQWVFHDAPFGYHLVNVLLHAACAALLVLVVRRLFAEDPGRAGTPLPAGHQDQPGGEGTRRPTGEGVAWLAGLIFAVHPVYVESVAWISEQKNTFSLFWYLLAGWVYMGREAQGDRQGAWWRSGHYWLATFFFLLAILSKSLTATLPCVLLVIAWWRRGRLSWDTWVPFLPWVLCGAAMGLYTGKVEHDLIGAQGEDFALGLVERGVLAGRVIWFYLGKYAWPAELIFIYPRWTVDLGAWWQWLFPAAAVGLLVWFLVLSRRMRGPLAGLLIFVGTLIPTIGFFNVYAFKFSYVADHWNYLPSVALAVMAAWGAVWLAGRLGGRAGSSSQPYLKIAAAVVLLLLAGLSWRECAGYRDLETFYRTILRENPDCWLALNNMGLLELNRNQPQAAIGYFEQTLQYRPKDPEPENNLGAALQRLGRNREAIPHFEAAIRKWPQYANAYYNLGNAHFNEGRVAEAVASFTKSIELQPTQTGARHNLGVALIQLGRSDEAISQFEQALAVRPDYPEAHHTLGLVLSRLDRLPQALPHLRAAVQLRPDSPEWVMDLALALTSAQQLPEAIAAFQRAQALRPDSSDVHLKFAVTLMMAGRDAEALEQNREGRRLRDLGR
jgi:tetratricopeptide (TPR) repeat protein